MSQVEHLADLDAGLPDDATAARLRAAAAADPGSAEVLRALAATRAELAALPPPTVPPELADRWTAALHSASAVDDATPRACSGSARAMDPPSSTAPPAPGPDDPQSAPGDLARPAGRPGAHPTEPPAGAPAPRPGPPVADGSRFSSAASRPARFRTAGPSGERPVRGRFATRPPGTRPPSTGSPPGGPGRRSPRRWHLAALAVGASVLVAAMVAGVVLLRPAAPPSVTAAQLGMFAGGAVGNTDLGELADPDRLAGCLQSVERPEAQVLGGRRVLLDGAPGVLLVLTTGVLGRYDVLVVDPACGPGGGTVLGSDTVGG